MSAALRGGMSAALRSAARALRDFLAGFTGIGAAPGAGAAPRESCTHDPRRTLEDAAARRGRCC